MIHHICKYPPPPRPVLLYVNMLTDKIVYCHLANVGGLQVNNLLTGDNFIVRSTNSVPPFLLQL